MASVISTTCFQPASGGEQEKFQLITSSQPFSSGVQLCTTLDPPGLAASFHSSVENDLAFNMYINAFPLSQTEIDSLSLGAASPFFENGVFFGLRDPVGTAPAGDLTTTRFSYVDGTTYDFGSTGHQLPWDGAEPNNFQGQSENCIEYNRETGLWNDINCSVNRRMFCRTKCIAPTPSPTPPPTSFPSPSPTSSPTNKITSSPTKAPSRKVTNSPSKAPTQEPSISTNAPTPIFTISVNSPTAQPFGVIQDPTSAPTQAVTSEGFSSNAGQLSSLVLALIVVGAIIPIALILIGALVKRRQARKRKPFSHDGSNVKLAEDDFVFEFWKSNKTSAKDIYLNIHLDEDNPEKDYPSGIRPQSVQSPRFSMDSMSTMRPTRGSVNASALGNSSPLASGVQFNRQSSNARDRLFRDDPWQVTQGLHGSMQSRQTPRYIVSKSVTAPALPPREVNIHTSDL